MKKHVLVKKSSLRGGGWEVVVVVRTVCATTSMHLIKNGLMPVHHNLFLVSALDAPEDLGPDDYEQECRDVSS